METELAWLMVGSCVRLLEHGIDPLGSAEGGECLQYLLKKVDASVQLSLQSGT
jgi:hypothetical protein